MHLTYISSQGLEQSALSFLAVDTPKSEKEMTNKEYDSSDGESDFLVVDENSPLLLDLDPPGTRFYKNGYVEGRKTGSNTKSLLSFKIKKAKGKRLPWIIFLTAFGMALMVVIGFMTMFQDTASTQSINTKNEFTNNAQSGNEVIASSPIPNEVVTPSPEQGPATGEFENKTTLLKSSSRDKVNSVITGRRKSRK